MSNVIPLPLKTKPVTRDDSVIVCGKCGSDVFTCLSLGVMHCVKCGTRVSNYHVTPSR